MDRQTLSKSSAPGRRAWFRRFLTGLMLTALAVWFFFFIVLPASAAALFQTATPTAPTYLVISEVRFNGSNGAGDEFVEIFNPTASNKDISGWKIRTSSNTGSVIDNFTFLPATPGTWIIQPGQHYLIVGAGAGFDDGVLPNGTLSTEIDNDGGAALTLADNTVIDAVGFSPLAAAAFTNGTSLTALPGGTD